MKVLLIGPHPPPHGGISVHVSGVHRLLTAAGITCRVLDTAKVRPTSGFAPAVVRHALDGWTLHFHANGHNWKSWFLAMACGLAGRLRGNPILTLHSGMVPGYLASAPRWQQKLAALTCALYGRVIVVNQDIANALFAIGLAPHRTEVLPAFVGTGGLEQPLDPQLVTWMERHRPLLSTVLFFRPEYGFDLLIAALAELRRRHPAFGCLVMGSGDQRAEAEEQVDRAGLHENVLFLGDVEHDACLALMSMCDVFVRPTREDGDSISVREALSLGVSVVASRAGVRPSGAILFQTGDAQDLEDKLQSVVTANRPAQPPATSPATGCMNRLLEIYAQVDGSEGALCLN